MDSGWIVKGHKVGDHPLIQNKMDNNSTGNASFIPPHPASQVSQDKNAGLIRPVLAKEVG